MCLLLCVGDHVVLEILPFRGLKGTSRLWAFEGVPSVNEAMCFQLTLVCSSKATDVTQVILGGTMGHHVTFEGMLPFETIATNLDRYIETECLQATAKDVRYNI